MEKSKSPGASVRELDRPAAEVAEAAEAAEVAETAEVTVELISPRDVKALRRKLLELNRQLLERAARWLPDESSIHGATSDEPMYVPPMGRETVRSRVRGYLAKKFNLTIASLGPKTSNSDDEYIEVNIKTTPGSVNRTLGHLSDAISSVLVKGGRP